MQTTCKLIYIYSARTHGYTYISVHKVFKWSGVGPSLSESKTRSDLKF